MVEVPLVTEGIPALLAKTADENAKVEVKRAKSFSGSAEDRTVNFMVTAEDDTTNNTYSVVLTKQKNPADLQPYAAEPFISELLVDLHSAWAFEICNPGNLPLNLSDYMITCTNNLDLATNITKTNEGDWLNRYDKYIPGYKWAANEAEWSVEQYIAQLDLAVNSTVQPGDVFLMAGVSDNNNYCDPKYHFTDLEIDVQFNNAVSDCKTWENQWGEEIDFDNGLPFSTRNMLICLWKIENDSVKQGLKPATDLNDFELIDVMGMKNMRKNG